ncbi:MAG: glycoside hydrolase family 65 protein, partial [Christensenellales bacterium]|nr:glycoside hydrolase family 65 protein [Christensenellales bacterium]
MSFPVHPWKVVERGWQPNTQRFAESLMSLANGYMGLRGNFEEDYSGDSFQGTYLGGVWYPDKTRVGWWKKGYPEYYAKVINTINLIGIHVIIDQHPLDLSRATVWEYEREVDMRTAVLYRHACVDMDKGSLTLDTWRFVSMDTKELLAIRYQVTPSFDCRMEVSPYLDGNVRNLDANYDQSFWNMVDGEGWDERGGVLVQTKPNPYGVQRFTVAAAMTNRVEGIDYID